MVTSSGAMTTLGGEAVQVDSVESTTTLWDIPGVETTSLAKMRDLVFYVDLTSKANVSAWAEATYKVAGVYKVSNDVATLVMTSGEEVTIRRTAQSGTIRMSDGVEYPIAAACTGTCASGSRRLNTDEGMAPLSPPRPRRLFGGALMTSGSFTMLAAGSNF